MRWPDARQELLLDVALGSDDEAVASWRRVRPDLNLDVLDAGAQALLPLVDRRLERLGLDDPDAARLRGIRRRTWYLNQLLLDRLAPVLQALEAGAARPLLAGSLELPLRYYGDLGVRRLAGLHALIDPHRADAAVAVLSRLGWPAPRNAGAHRFRFVSPQGDECILYLRLLREFPGSFGDPWSRSEEVLVAGSAHAALPPAHEFARVCLDDATSPNPIWVADALSVLRAVEIDWSELLGLARAARATSRLHDVCTYLVRTFDAAIPPATLSELDAAKTLRRERLADRLASVAPPTATTFLRATASQPLVRSLRSLPSFLQQEWGVQRATELPGVALRKLRARLSRGGPTSPRRDRAL